MLGVLSFSEDAFSSEGGGPLIVGSLSATGSVGTVSVVADANVAVTGVEGTAVVGNQSVTTVNNVFPSGLGATGSVGSAVGSTPVDVAVTGVSGFGKTAFPIDQGPLFGDQTTAESPFSSLNEGESTISFELGVSESVSGLEATSAVGSVTVNGDANAPVTGLSATASVGSVDVEADANAAVTGVSATGNVGSVTVGEGQGASPLVSAPRMVGRLGIVTAVPETNIFVTGVAGTGEVGELNQTIWNPINPSQQTVWKQIAA